MNEKYKSDLDLLVKLDPLNKHIPILKSGESSFTKNLLKKDIERFSVQKAPEQEAVETNVPDRSDYIQKHETKYIKIDFGSLPPELRQIDKHRRQLYKRSADAFTILKQAKTDRQRYDLARIIVDDFLEIQEMWQKLEEYQISGKRPDPPKIEALEELTALELSNIRNNLQKNIYRHRLKKENSEKLQQLERELTLIEQQLHKR